MQWRQEREQLKVDTVDTKHPRGPLVKELRVGVGVELERCFVVTLALSKFPFLGDGIFRS